MKEKYQRRHYEDIAAILATIKNDITRIEMTDKFVRLFEDDNYRFDEQKFREAITKALPGLNYPAQHRKG